MAATLLLSSNATIISASTVNVHNIGRCRMFGKERKPCSSNRLRVVVVAVTQSSADSTKSEETAPSWAEPDSDELPPWAQDETNNSASQLEEGFQIPFYVYLLASTITAIAAIGSIFYVNQRPVFGVWDQTAHFMLLCLDFLPSQALPSLDSCGSSQFKLPTRKLRDGYF